uniref:Legume lectin domain-containing protein n=1 Tax=Leersia perrieri TaxID=77586 RepID=A0A0D9WM61_9ORYZ
MAIASSSSSSSSLLLIFLAFLIHTCEGGDHDHAVAAAAAVTANVTSIEAAVRDRAFQLFRRTSEIVNVDVNVSLAAVTAGAIEATATRVRSNALWADGINATAVAVTVPPRVVTAPFARRVAIVFLRFAANASPPLFSPPPGYDLAAPVVAILAYDAASGSNSPVSLRALGAPVRIEFNSSTAPTARCVTFAGGGGEAVATHDVAAGTSRCEVSGTGHYGLAVKKPAPAPVNTPTSTPVREKWWVWKVAVSAGGIAAASFVMISVAGVVRWRRRRRREEMERRAMGGEELGRMAVRGSRMPSAKMVRTRPEVEEESSPPPLPWRKS